MTYDVRAGQLDSGRLCEGKEQQVKGSYQGSMPGVSDIFSNAY